MISPSFARTTSASRRRPRSRPLLASAAAVGLICVSVVAPASAHDDSDTSTYGITNSWDYFSPSGSYDQAANGKKVHLSSPRHTDSGRRGERTNPGRQENENGRGFNFRAANGNFIGETYASSNSGRNLHSRGFKVWVGPNPKDGGIAANRTHAQNWGADLTIITHSNAGGGSYNLVMWDSAQDKRFATQLSKSLGPGVPGGDNVGSDNTYVGGNLYELKGDAAHGDAYVELQFHDNQSMQSWMYNQAHTAAYRYGVAADIFLGYP